MSDKRMYSTGLNNCPVKLLKSLIRRTDNNAPFLFNQCVKEAIAQPTIHEIWYTTKSLGKTSFKSFMADICKYANCSQKYTAHCIRATSIQAMNDAGFEARQIMFMTGHRNEASIRSYNRDCSTHQKKSISTTLSAVASGNQSTLPLPVVPVTSSTSTPLNLSQTHSQSSQNVHVHPFSASNASGFLCNSNFTGCNFYFKSSG